MLFQLKFMVFVFLHFFPSSTENNPRHIRRPSAGAQRFARATGVFGDRQSDAEHYVDQEEQPIAKW
jgi:hypothetical protein